MLENIVFVILTIIAVAAAVWVLWIENHDPKKNITDKNSEKKKN